MTALNEAQQRELAAHGLTELPAAGTGHSDLRLQIANLAAVPDPAPVAPPVELNPAAKEWLGDRDPNKLDAENRALFEYVRDDPAFNRAAPETAPADKAAALDGPIDWRTAKLDTSRLSEEPNLQTRIDVTHAYDRIRKVGPANVREIDLLLATKFLAR